jgi:hypothetical protein
MVSDEAGARSGRRRAPADRKGGIVRLFKGKNPFSFLFGSSRRERFLARYVLREHRRGRPLAEILDDPYVRNRSTPEERRRLLDEPDVVAALGDSALDELRQGLAPAR